MTLYERKLYIFKLLWKIIYFDREDLGSILGLSRSSSPNKINTICYNNYKKTNINHPIGTIIHEIISIIRIMCLHNFSQLYRKNIINILKIVAKLLIDTINTNKYDTIESLQHRISMAMI